MTNLYEQANTNTEEASVGGEGQAHTLGDTHGQRNPVYLSIGNGGCLHAGSVGQGSGQRRDFQNDFTRFFYSYRRHDWVPVWYQTHAK